MTNSIKHADGTSESGLEREERLFSAPQIADVSAIDSKHVVQRMTAIALATLQTVTKAHVTSAIKSAEKYVSAMQANHANPTGTDVRRTMAIWSSRQAVSMLLALFQSFGFDKPSEMTNRVWKYATVTGAQRSGNDYLALKAQDKLLALAGWLLSGDPRTNWNKCKYLVSIVVTMEVLNVDCVSNEDIYSVYMSHQARLDSLTVDCDADLKARLYDAQLYKSAATASTQRTTSANLLQLLGAGTNAGNERKIYVDRESGVYQALRMSLFGDAI